jgi:hypothetical protein
MNKMIMLGLLLATVHPSLATNVVSAASLKEGVPIIGFLGHPLGTIVTVQCTGAPTPLQQTKDDNWTRAVVILSVNEEQLTTPVTMELRSFPWAKVDVPKPKEVVTIVGYETGGYKGIPGKVFAFIPATQTKEYQFETAFQAVKRIAGNSAQRSSGYQR